MRALLLAGAAAVAGLGTIARASPPAPKPISIDFGDEPDGSLGEQLTAPPPDIKHPSLLSDKYRGVADPTTIAALDDPLAPRATTTESADRPLWLGARLGVGIFDDALAAARGGFALAATARYRVSDAAFLAARADWTRRGGDTMTATIDTLGASAGLGLTILGRTPHIPHSQRTAPRSMTSPAPEPAIADTAPRHAEISDVPVGAPTASRPHDRLAIAVVAQVRADVRLADHRAGAPVQRAGLSLAAGAELALPSTPFTLGLRFEQGLTDLVPGSRDRAILAEVGIDLR